MGYMRHHAILVTGIDFGRAEKNVSELHRAVIDEAERFGLAHLVSPLSPPAMNGHRTFTVVPDGSKEGWGESDRGESFRREVIDLFLSFRYQDRSSPVAWALVQYGDDSGDNRVVWTDANWRDTPVIAGSAPKQQQQAGA